jgi:NADP-dependent 3-hydroxy acid dehydrogenase YdfG
MADALSGEVAWITGAGTGIGRAIAETLAAAGAAVALTGRKPAPLEATATAIAAAGGRAIVVLADVTRADAVADAHGRVVGELGTPGILVNNAGMNLARRHYRDLSPADAAALVETNLTAPFLCVLQVLPTMRAAGGGTLVHVASLAGKGLFLPSGPAYSAAKHGVAAMSALINAEEGIHGIRSICVSPGEVDTPMLSQRPTPLSREHLATVLKPQDIADTVLFALSLPKRACLADIVIVPTDNPAHRGEARALAQRA